MSGALKYRTNPNSDEWFIAGCGTDGATFTPAVDDEGNLSWTNDKGLPNPETVNIKGPAAEECGVKCTNLSVGANESVRFSFSGSLFLIGRLTAAASACGCYAMSSYASIRAPLISTLSAGTNMSVSSGGDNTNGWYVTVANTNSSSVVMFSLIGNCTPTLL